LKVSLVLSSQPSKELAEQGIVNAQELVAYCARVSNPANQNNILNYALAQRLKRNIEK